MAATVVSATPLTATDTPPPAKIADAWTGTVECKLDVDVGDYHRHETQTWTLTGDSLGIQWNGNMPLYPAKWKYSGSGSSRKVTGSDFSTAVTTQDWKIDTEKDVHLAIFVRASDKRLTLHQWEAILSVPNAITDNQTYGTLGAAYVPSTMTYAADQWNFGWIEGDQTAATLTGSRTVTTPGLPALINTTPLPTATCTWNFTRTTSSTTVAAPPAAATSGSYRIILNGFRCNQETFHDLLNPDGTGDDVFAGAHVHYASRNAAPAANPLTVVSSSLVKSAVHGLKFDGVLSFTTDGTPPDNANQVNAAKIRAGSATSTGGIKNGDVFPTGSNPSTLTTAPVANSFPLLLWQGQLTNNQDAVVVIPSLWKSINGDSAHFDTTPWATQNSIALWTPAEGGPYANQDLMRTRITSGDLTPIPNAGSLEMCVGDSDLGATLTCLKFDHPIGMQFIQQSVAQFPNAEVIVTREAIEAALGAGRSYGAGLAPGVIMLHFQEQGPNMRGNYDLFLRVERAQEITTVPGLTVSPPLANLSLASITQVTPNSAPQWTDEVVVTFTGSNTHFVQGKTTLDLGPGITLVNQGWSTGRNTPTPPAVDVASPTTALATLKIAGDATTGPRAVKLSTGSEVVSLANGFTVTARDVHDVFQVSPNSSQAGQQGLVITISRPSGYPAGYFSWQGTTLDFGPGITVASFASVPGSDYLAHATATLNIAAGATFGPRTITIKRPGFSDESFAGAFTVNARSLAVGKGTPPPIALGNPPPGSLSNLLPAITSVTPTSGQRGTASVVITINGRNTHFVQGSTTVDLGSGIQLTDAQVFVVSPTQVLGHFKISATANPGAVQVSVTTGHEVARLANAFTVTP